MATMGGGSHRVPFKIFDTDYENYEIYYDCSQFGAMKTESFAVSSRTKVMTPEVLETVKAVIKEKIPQYDLDESSLLYWDKQGGWCNYEWRFN